MPARFAFALVLALSTCACGRTRTSAVEGTATTRAELDRGVGRISIHAPTKHVRTTTRPGRSLRFEFSAEASSIDQVLGLTQAGAVGLWELRVNGQTIGALHRETHPMRAYFPVPAGVLVTGTNELELVARDAGASVSLSEVELLLAPMAEALGLGQVQVEVRDAEGGEGLPARVSILDGQGRPAGILTAQAGDVAIRPGIAYLGPEGRGFGLPAGDYELVVTRGMEWSLGRASVHIEPGQSLDQIIELRRELDTRGWIAADTHIHTLTHSGHGDASVRERVLTLAGEGVELAVATDHNHHTDFGPLQAELGLAAHYTAVTGNEVTTDNGHFTAFPLALDTAPPNAEERDWVKLVASMREAGAKVVVLNHPHWPSLETGPFGLFGFDTATGARASGTEFTFDGIELVNSTTLDPEPLGLVHDWLALLNRGERLVAVGSSDSHTVGDPVGQARCYVPSATDDPATIDVDAATQAYLDGRVSVAMGIFADLRLGRGQARPGDEVEIGAGTVPVKVRVAAPGWVRPRQALVFVNGVEAARMTIGASTGPTEVWLEGEVELDGRDAYVVAIVLGEGVELLGWPMMADYTFAATNPVYVEGDGRPGWTAPGPSGLEPDHGHP